jgi:hypothetical protein
MLGHYLMRSEFGELVLRAQGSEQSVAWCAVCRFFLWHASSSPKCNFMINDGGREDAIASSPDISRKSGK